MFRGSVSASKDRIFLAEHVLFGHPDPTEGNASTALKIPLIPYIYILVGVCCIRILRKVRTFIRAEPVLCVDLLPGKCAYYRSFNFCRQSLQHILQICLFLPR